MNDIIELLVGKFGLAGLLAVAAYFLLSRILTKEKLEKLPSSQFNLLFYCGLFLFFLSILFTTASVFNSKKTPEYCRDASTTIKFDFKSAIVAFETDNNQLELRKNLLDNLRCSINTLDDCELTKPETGLLQNHVDSLVYILHQIIESS